MTRTPAHRTTSTLALALALGLGLAACGEGDSEVAAEPTTSVSSTTSPETPTDSPTEEPSEEPSEPRGPACADVWVAGEPLPGNYSGCQDADSDSWKQAMVYMCSSGQRLVTFGRTFYAAKGEVITESATPLARNPEFRKVLASCGA